MPVATCPSFGVPPDASDPFLVPRSRAVAVAWALVKRAAVLDPSAAAMDAEHRYADRFTAFLCTLYLAGLETFATRLRAHAHAVSDGLLPWQDLISLSEEETR